MADIFWGKEFSYLYFRNGRLFFVLIQRSPVNYIFDKFDVIGLIKFISFCSLLETFFWIFSVLFVVAIV